MYSSVKKNHYSTNHLKTEVTPSPLSPSSSSSDNSKKDIKVPDKQQLTSIIKKILRDDPSVREYLDNFIRDTVKDTFNEYLDIFKSPDGVVSDVSSDGVVPSPDGAAISPLERPLGFTLKPSLKKKTNDKKISYHLLSENFKEQLQKNIDKKVSLVE